MKILQLTAENVKKLKVVDITPSDNFVQVTGPNGSGKTSVLDSIWWALGGKDGIQSVPIRKGADKARIRLNLGSIVVERKFTPNGTTLTVKNEEGAVYPSPQSMLDDLIGTLSFDPLAFARKDAAEQYEELRVIAKVEVDLRALEAENAADFKARTGLNREAKEKRSQAAGMEIAKDLPEQPIDESAILGEMEKAAGHNATLEQRKARRSQVQADANTNTAEGVQLREASARTRDETARRVKELERQIQQVKKDGEDAALAFDKRASKALDAAAALGKQIDEAPALPDPIDISELRASIDRAKLTNAEIAKRERRHAVEAEAKTLEGQAEVLTRAMAAREDRKRIALQAAEMPVEGLGLSEGRVIFNGLPFDQASDAEQLQASLAIAMAGNPKLRVIRIRDGSLLDEKGLATVAALAREKDYQIWVERVDSTGTIGIVMEDGEVKAQ